MVQIKRKGFRQITQEERVEIYSFLREGLTMREIWRRLERSHTSISREIVRNGIDYGWWKSVYKPVEAEKKKRKRKHKANRSHVKLRENTQLRMKILYLLSHTDWWPDEILWRLKHEWWNVVSTSTLYRYIYLYSPQWKQYLLHKAWWYKKRYGNKQWVRYTDIPYCEEREASREEKWHTENDSIECGSGKWWLTVSLFRHSRYGQMRKVSSLCGRETYGAMKEMLWWHEVRSITIDNGSEFSEIRQFRTKLYRCHAYSAWEKWSVERHNWLIRRYIPKWTIISELTGERLQEIESKLNHKPRKILGYRTPYEVQYTTNLAYIS